MKMVSKPTVNAFLLCDLVVTEAKTNKKSLIGIFEQISTPKFPCIHHSLSVYIKFTDIQPGKYRLTLLLKDLKDNRIIAQGETNWITIPEKLGVYELAFNLYGVKFIHEGKYEFELRGNDEYFASKTFEVKEMRKGG